MDEKSLALLMIYESVKDRLSISFEEYKNAVNKWDIVPLQENKKIIGGVLVKDNELHVGYGEKPKSSIKRYIKEILNRVIDAYGEVVTSVDCNNKTGLNFCKRLGFVETNIENGVIRLKCIRSNYK